jgi:hypothetical protein
MTIAAALLLIIVQQGAATLLLVAGRRHQRHRSVLVHHLRVHRVLPRRWIGPVGRALPISSIAIGAVVLAVPLVTSVLAPGRWPEAARLAAGLVATTYLTFLIYLYALRRRAPDVPCGCLGSPGERTDHSIVRAATVVLACAAAVLPIPLRSVSQVPGFPVLILIATALGAAAAAGAAALILAWIAIVVLAFGFAALLQQVRSLQAALRLPPGARAGLPQSARALEPAATDRRYVLTVDPGCAVCSEVLPEFRELAARHAGVAEFAVLAPSGDYPVSPGVQILVDADAYRDLAPSWSPGIVAIGPGGTVIEVAPGGDLGPLQAALANATASSAAN